MNGKRAAVLALLAATQLIGVIDFSIVTIAIPSIGRQFSLRSDQLQWAMSAYVLMQAGFVLLGGRLCDAVNTKRIFMGALALFGIASLAGGFAPNSTLLFIARGVQGLAGAVLAPGSLVLVTREFAPGEARNRALGIFGGVAALGFLLGVIIGGAITGYLGWRWVFFVNVPIVIVMLATAAVLLPDENGARPESRLDVPGAAVGTAAILALIAGISTSSGGLPRLVPFTVVAAALVALFVWIERAAVNPLVPFAVFRSKQFTGAIAGFGLVNVGAAMVPLTLTLAVQGTLRLSPQATGLLLVPAGIGGIAGGLAAGLAVRRFGLRKTVAFALAILVASNVPLLGPGLHGSAAWVALGFGVGATGFVGCSVANTIAATSAIAGERMGLAGGLLNTSQFVGSALGAAVAGALIVPATVSAYSTSLLVAVFLSLLALAIALIAFGPTSGEGENRARPLVPAPAGGSDH